MIFWYGSPIKITRFSASSDSYVDVIHMRGPSKHGPEFMQWKTNSFLNNMYTHGSSTGN